MKSFVFVAFCLGCLIVVSPMTGCGGPGIAAPAPSKPAEKPDAAPPAVPSTETAQLKIPIKIASWDETQKLIADQKGKIVVIDFWSSYCDPCIKELPNLVKLHEKHGKDVVCLTFNCNFDGTDSPESLRPDVEKFLTEQKATCQNLISSEADEVLYKKVGFASIPVVQVYDRTGKLSKQFDDEKQEYGKDGFNYTEHITPYVERLLKE